jgi:hypothetical protein
MEVLCDREDERLVLWYALDFVAPLARHLHGGLYCLGASVHGQDHVKSKQLGRVLCETREDIVVECSTAEGQTRGLLGQCLYKLGVAVALVDGGIC